MIFPLSYEEILQPDTIDMGEGVPGYRNDELPFIYIRNIWSIDAKHPILINRGLLFLP